MKIIEVEIYWTDKNYCCGWSSPEVGTIVCTDKTLDGVKRAFAESLEFHIEGMLADGDTVPEWLATHQYDISYTMSVSAILRNMERYTTIAAISRVTGINQKLLSNYASSIKKPSPQQRQRIIDGLHEIGNAFMMV